MSRLKPGPSSQLKEHAMHVVFSEVKRPNLKLKTR
jgi:hypothetical protein